VNWFVSWIVRADYYERAPRSAVGLVILASAGIVLMMPFGGLIYFNKMASTMADVV